MKRLLDNIAWHTLAGPHAKYSVGTEDVRRYAPGFSPIIGFANVEHPSLDALAPYCEPVEHFYTDGWSGNAPVGWNVETESTMFKMVWEGGALANHNDPQIMKLGSEHAAQALELATLTQPGPFGLRTIELGDYFGCFHKSRLMAMAGERMCAGTFREISGVCTHPDFQGRGLARSLVTELLQRQSQRGETPFLHVMRDNEIARRFYEKMGFRNYRESVVRVISRR